MYRRRSEKRLNSDANDSLAAADGDTIVRPVVGSCTLLVPGVVAKSSSLLAEIRINEPPRGGKLTRIK